MMGTHIHLHIYIKEVMIANLIRSQFYFGVQYEYEDWVAEQCGQERIEGWRKEMFVGVLKNAKSYQDERDDGHLFSQAHRDFTKYF